MHLDLEDTQVSDQGIHNLPPIDYLEDLSLRGTRHITVAGVRALHRFATLRKLCVPVVIGADALADSIAGLDSLETVDADDGFSDAGLESISRLANLTILQVGGDRFTAAGLAHLQGCHN